MSYIEETKVGIRISGEELNARTLGVIRRETRLSISEIQSRAEKGRFICECDETNDEGIEQIISLYEKLAKLDCNPTLYEDGAESDVESLKQTLAWYQSMEQEDD